jgi:hypothetical protein
MPMDDPENSIDIVDEPANLIDAIEYEVEVFSNINSQC